MGREHSFQALGFPENVPLRSLATAFPQARRTPLELRVELDGGGTMFLYPFGAVDVSRDRRLVLLEVTIVVLIVLELALSLLRRG